MQKYFWEFYLRVLFKWLQEFTDEVYLTNSDIQLEPLGVRRAVQPHAALQTAIFSNQSCQ
jgi:hypothetical protein